MTFMKFLRMKEEDLKATGACWAKQNFSPASLRKLPTHHQMQWQVSQHARHNGQEHIATPKIHRRPYSGAHPAGIHPGVQELPLLHQDFGQDHGCHGGNGRILLATLSPIGQGPLFARKEK